MKKTLLLFALLASACFAQTLPVPAALPSITVGAGPSWTRGGNSPYSFDATLAVHIGKTQWYSWTDISTPISTSTSAQPVVSTITTGAAWIAAQSASGCVALVTIIQAGFSAVAANSTIAPSFTGSLGVAFRLGKSNVYLMPYAKASNAATSTSSGALATAVFQPGVQILYGFGGK